MAKTGRRRLDQAVVDLGLAPTLSQAQSLVMAGRVQVDGQRSDKPGTAVGDGQVIQVAAAEPFVGRGGLKLRAALEHFGISVAGLTCLDVGASTGGFTDCLLQRGAAKVYAVDAGHGQLDWKLRQDARVVNLEHRNGRDLKPEDFGGEAIAFFCMDVSFISAKKILPAVAAVLRPGGEWVVLVKPQFEAKREEVAPGGLVLDPQVHERVCREVFEAASDLGLGPRPVISSPLRGAEGNTEFLLTGKKGT